MGDRAGGGLVVGPALTAIAQAIGQGVDHPDMTNSKRTVLGGLLAGAALALSACGGVDREGSIEQLMETGLDRQQATCVLDGSIDAFGESRVTSDDPLTAEEEETMTGIVVDCMG